MTTTTTEPGRWGIQHTRYAWPQCRFCGRATDTQEPNCRPGVCLACGSRQCNSRQGRCIVCLVGIMPDWSGWRRECGYTGCQAQAVARAPRVGVVCAEHLSRPTRRWAGTTISLAEDIARRVAERDGTVRVAYSAVRFVWMPEVAS
jgi:hypothetical protein